MLRNLSRSRVNMFLFFWLLNNYEVEVLASNLVLMQIAFSVFKVLSKLSILPLIFFNFRGSRACPQTPLELSVGHVCVGKICGFACFTVAALN